MIIEQAILTELGKNSTLTGLVSSRIYYVKAPQDVTEPYIVFFKVSSPRNHSYSGSSHLAESLFQFSVFSTTYTEAKSIVAQIQTSLQGFTGTMGTTPGVYVGSCFFDNETDLYENETKLFHIALDFTMLHYD